MGPRPLREHPPGSGLATALVRGVAATLVARVLALIGWIAVTPFVLAALGPERFGFWSLVATAGGLSLTLDFGVAAAVTRFVARHRAAGDRGAMRGALTFGLLAGGVLGAGWLAAALAIPGPLLDLARVPEGLREEAALTLAVAGVAFALNLLALVPGAALAGFQRLDLAQANLLAATLVQVLATVAVLARGGGLAALAAAAAAAALVSLVLGWWTLRRIWPGAAPAWPPPAGARGAFGRFGVALQAVNLGVLAQYQMPKLFFTRWLGLPAVGQFELGWRAAFAAWSLPSLMLPPLLPAASHLDAAGERARLIALYLRASRYLLPVALTTALGLAALAEVAFAAWLGPGHGDAARALAAIGVLLGINVLTSPGCLIARGAGRPALEVEYHAVSFAIQAGLGLALVPAWGFAGGLAAMAISGTVGTALFLVRFHRRHGVPLGGFLRDVVARPALAATLAALAAGWASQAVAGAGIVSRSHALGALGAGLAALLTVSAAATFATGALRGADVREIAALLRGAGARAA